MHAVALQRIFIIVLLVAAGVLQKPCDAWMRAGHNMKLTKSPLGERLQRLTQRCVDMRGNPVVDVALELFWVGALQAAQRQRQAVVNNKLQGAKQGLVHGPTFIGSDTRAKVSQCPQGGNLKSARTLGLLRDAVAS